MPFILETEAAVTLMERAILHRARVVRFPWQLQWLLRMPSLLPRPVARALIRRLSLPNARTSELARLR
jgi:hypothetical protein